MFPSRSDDFRLPELRFVPCSSLIPHERHDNQRMQPLADRMREQGMLKNPPIVTPLPSENGEERYMVLDGANRSTAIRGAGMPHVVVQVVKYEDPWVHLTTWDHAISEMDPAEFAKACRKVKGLEVREESILHARAELARRSALAYAAHDDEHAISLYGGEDLEHRNELLNSIVNVYRKKHRFYRMSTETFAVAKNRHPDITTLVVFPHFDPAEVLELAGSGSKLPAGITRHLIRWRALRINVSIDMLEDEKTPLAEKNAWLEKYALDKFNERSVRFYEEPTVLFDE